MFTAKNGDTTKCINAWTGLGIIALVCTIVSIAVFVQFQTPTARVRKVKLQAKPKSFTPVAFNGTGAWNRNASNQQDGNSILF